MLFSLSHSFLSSTTQFFLLILSLIFPYFLLFSLLYHLLIPSFLLFEYQPIFIFHSLIPINYRYFPLSRSTPILSNVLDFKFFSPWFSIRVYPFVLSIIVSLQVDPVSFTPKFSLLDMFHLYLTPFPQSILPNQKFFHFNHSYWLSFSLNWNVL